MDRTEDNDDLVAQAVSPHTSGSSMMLAWRRPRGASSKPASLRGPDTGVVVDARPCSHAGRHTSASDAAVFQVWLLR
eukprot:355251-Chlamydomonas_euryale.AAC.6